MPEDKFKCEIMGWNLFYDLSKLVAKKINDSDYKPDIVIGLARGGWVLARVLCDIIGVKDLVSLKVEHWGITATPDGKAKLKYPFKIDLTGKKALVVPCDVGSKEQVKIMVDQAVKEFGSVDIRVNTAQGWGPGGLEQVPTLMLMPLADFPEDVWDHQFSDLCKS